MGEGIPIPDRVTQKERAERLELSRSVATAIAPGMTVAVVTRDNRFPIDPILERSPASIVTNGLSFETRYRRRGHATSFVYVPGQIGPGGAAVGALALAFIEQIHLDALVIDCEGATARGGIRSSDLSQAQFCRALVRRSRTTLAICHSSAWGEIALSPSVDWREVDLFLTNATLTPDENMMIDAARRAAPHDVRGRGSTVTTPELALR